MTTRSQGSFSQIFSPKKLEGRNDVSKMSKPNDRDASLLNEKTQSHKSKFFAQIGKSYH